MSYKVEALSELETIKITVDGKLSPYEKIKAYFEAIEELKINNYQRLLFDFSSAISSKKNTCRDSIDLFNDMKQRQLEKKLNWQS